MRCSSGHVWQGRYYSCPLDESHLWEALRYTELNPVRASMVAKAEGWGWSSAAAHCGSAAAESWLGMGLWRKRWSAAGWREYLEAGESQAALAAIRHNTHTGRPLGRRSFCAQWKGRQSGALLCKSAGRVGDRRKIPDESSAPAYTTERPAFMTGYVRLSRRSPSPAGVLSATMPEEPDQTSRSSCHASEGECPQQSRLLR